MNLDPQIIGPICGAIVAACGAFVTWLRFRDRNLERLARLNATPEQRVELDKMPPPPPLPGAAPMIALIVGGGLAIGMPLALGQAHPSEVLERLEAKAADEGSTKGASPAGRRCSPPCTGNTQCVDGKCQGNAARPRPRPKMAGTNPPIESMALVDRGADSNPDPSDDRWCAGG